jgi:hypothetical protein
MRHGTVCAGVNSDFNVALIAPREDSGIGNGNVGMDPAVLTRSDEGYIFHTLGTIDDDCLANGA